MATFTLDLEDWNHGLHEHSKGHSSAYVVTDFLLPLLKKHRIRATFYVLGRFMKEQPETVQEVIRDGHIIKDHGYWHDYGEPADRSPYFSNGDMPGWSGGFFFRLFPLPIFKWFLKRSGVFWLHPHDIDANHPTCRNFILNVKRHWGLKNAQSKLERLCEEVEFAS